MHNTVDVQKWALFKNHWFDSRSKVRSGSLKTTGVPELVDFTGHHEFLSQVLSRVCSMHARFRIHGGRGCKMHENRVT